jgi:Flp pilus assembly protein TadG
MRILRAEKGASLIMVAITLFLLIGSAALAVDIGATWADRSADQKITDSASAAGALEAVEGGTPRSACQVALAYVATNAREINSINDSGCTNEFTTAKCDPLVTQELTITEGRYDITVRHPVANDDDLMTSGIVGATAQPLHADDGKPCGRVAVEMTATRRSLFAQLLGFAQGRTTVHTVAVAAPASEEPPINLLVLNRHECETISVSGGGGVIVEAIIDKDPDTGVESLVQGTIAADSDGTVGCNTRGVLHVASNSARMWAHGPDGCGTPPQFGTHSVGSFTAGDGCGRIQVYAPGTPGCDPPPANFPACTPGGSSNKPKPDPTRLAKPFTREKVDHRYNCFGDYTWNTMNPGTVGWATEALTVANWQDIKPCTSGDPDSIYDLIRKVGATGTPSSSLATWSPWPHGCSPSTTINITGNFHINCPSGSGFSVSGDVQINGKVVFTGNVRIGSGGHLKIVNTLAQPGWAFFRSGSLSNTANGSVTFDNTMVYMSKTSSVNIGASNGKVTWIAPDSGPFDDLALWSDAIGTTHKWTGQADLVMEGVFFIPRSTAEYVGGSAQSNTKAQWIADKLYASGNSALVVAPADGRSIPFAGTGTALIR